MGVILAENFKKKCTKKKLVNLEAFFVLIIFFRPNITEFEENEFKLFSFILSGCFNSAENAAKFHQIAETCINKKQDCSYIKAKP